MSPPKVRPPSCQTCGGVRVSRGRKRDTSITRPPSSPLAVLALGTSPICLWILFSKGLRLAWMCWAQRFGYAILRACLHVWLSVCMHVYGLEWSCMQTATTPGTWNSEELQLVGKHDIKDIQVGTKHCPKGQVAQPVRIHLMQPHQHCVLARVRPRACACQLHEHDANR